MSSPRSTGTTQLSGPLTPRSLSRLSEQLSEVRDERARVRLMSDRLSQAELSVLQLAELLELFELEAARLEAIDRLAARLVEGDEEGERRALLDLFEDPSSRARAVDLLGWH